MSLESQDLYKLKYIKYKKKYLELKGGKKCPTLGFHQHIGECWHDAYSTIMLFTDNISNNAQHILENYTKDFETVEELVEDILNFSEINQNLKILLPLNIDDSVYEKYERYSRNYLINLFNRYLNEGLKLKKDVIIPKNKRLQMGLIRQNSVKKSLLCTTNVFNIININNNNMDTHNVITQPGLHEKNLYFITCTLNYYLINYILPNDRKTKTPEEMNDIPKNYIYNQFINIDEIFNTKITTPNQLISRLLQIKESLNKCDAINIGISKYNSKLSDIGNFVGNDDVNIGHMLCMFTCDKIGYFYDNEGIDKYVLNGGAGTENFDEESGESIQTFDSVQSFREEDVRAAIEKKFGMGVFDEKDAEKPSEIYKTFTKFDWKKYFSDTFDKIIASVRQNIEKQKKDTKVISKEYYGTLRQSLSSFLRSNKLWNNFHIETIQLYTLNKFELGKSIVEKETTYYSSLLKVFQYWNILSDYNLDPVRIERFIINNNTKMLELLYNYRSFRDYLTDTGKQELLKILELNYNAKNK
jgi:hypothetical protein